MNMGWIENFANSQTILLKSLSWEFVGFVCA